ncbi:hypothetical protein [Sabulicella glaciei]|uniref:Uncharacterized protein n=1 Tax=Sabulicella glaciei TaxID=2984948 RepID=A0ABT3NVB1_9PROT|nr:hypothetical protein [Roseococcus sp. MDT2-1-1]MCW8086095.1 hypothetical protein [Roseococcus sp. MDT2-1-1]
MTISLSSSDHQKLDRMLDTILMAHAQGKISLSDARSALAHFVGAAMTQNEGEVRSWLKPETFGEFEDLIDAHRP